MNFGIEDETLEFKKTTGELNEAMKSVCAMLNKHGHGLIYFGVLPNGEVMGQIINDSTLRDVSRKVFETISPQIIPTITKKNVDGKEIVELSFKGNEKPYSCNGVYYIRVADEDKVLKPNELRQLFEYNNGISWDAELTNFGMDDVDINSLRSFFNKAIACKRLKEESFNPEELLIKLGLLADGRLTNAGHYMFSKNGPIVLKMAIFATNEKLTFLDVNRQTGNIISLINEANSYISKNLHWSAEIVDFKRVETPEIPLEAIREIVCNSFAHARYNTTTEHEISIHPGMVRIYNPGEFPIGYKPEDFATENIPSIIRNPLILKTLFLSDDVESYSSGFRRVFEKCKNSGVKFSYEIQREGFTFTFNRNVVNDVVNDVVNKELNSIEQNVINILKKYPTSSALSISKMVNMSERSIQRIFKSLKTKGYIKRNGTTKGYWEVIK